MQEAFKFYKSKMMQPDLKNVVDFTDKDNDKVSFLLQGIVSNFF